MHKALSLITDQSLLKIINVAQYLLTIRADQFSRCRGSRCPHVGDKICDGKIDFVTDSTDNRQLRVGNFARQNLIVKCPEIFE